MSDESSHNSSLFWGLFLIGLGVIFLFDNLGLLDFGNFISDFWPVILIAIGARIIWKARNEGEKNVLGGKPEEQSSSSPESA